MNKVSQGISDFLELFFPELCITCGERLVSQEKYLCLNCWADVPVSNFHLNDKNKVAQLFWGRVHLEGASSFFIFRKGSNYQKLIHYIKYKGLKELGFEVGRRYGFSLVESELYHSVDIVVPVPLHPKKQKKRGYNQSDWIAKGFAYALKKPVSATNLYREIHTTTQTRKNRFERWQNVEGIFGINDRKEFEGKHILLVDDVVTTGSTLEACAFTLLNLNNTKVSIATLAYADI